MKKLLVFAAVAAVAAGARWLRPRISLAPLSSAEARSLRDAPNDDQKAPQIDLQKMGLDPAAAPAPVATPEAAVVPSAQADAGAQAAALADLSDQVAKILGKIKKLETRTCSATHYDNFAFEYDDDCTVDNSYYVKSSVDSQTKIAMSLARDMIKNGQLDLAADAIKAIKTQSMGYFDGGTMAHGEVLYYSEQVENLVDTALKVLKSEKTASAASAAK